MIPLPSLLAPFVKSGGKIAAPWNFYLQQFTQAPPAMLPVVPDGSPFFYTAAEPGLVAVSGGTVSEIALLRGNDGIIVTGQALIPVAIADVVRVTYSVIPTMKFIPSYGQRTG